MKVYEVYGIVKSFIREKEVFFMDDKYVYNKEGLRSERFTTFGSHALTYEQAVIDAIEITKHKIDIVNENLSELRTTQLEYYRKHLSNDIQMMKKLRDYTGCGLGDCKKAILWSEGDWDKAIEIIESMTQAVVRKPYPHIVAKEEWEKKHSKGNI